MVASLRKTVRSMVFTNRQLAQLYYFLSFSRPVLPQWVGTDYYVKNHLGNYNQTAVHVVLNLLNICRIIIFKIRIYSILVQDLIIF